MEQKIRLQTNRKEMVKKIATGVAVAALAPFLAFAQYSTTTASTDVKSVINDVGSGISSVVPVVLAILAGLLLLGWGVRSFRKHVAGKKF